MINADNIPKGFFSAALKSGIKNNGYDLAIIKSEPPSIVSALYTQNKFQAAPIIFSKKNDKNKIDLLMVNSGVANSLTGKKGYDNVLNIANFASKYFKCKKENILTASTGIIGVHLDVDKIKNAIKKSSLNEGFDNIVKAIQTRDKFDKVYSTKLNIENKTANFYAIAKGTSIIHPNMATVLLFIFTDLNIEKEALNKAFRESINKTLNRISIDGETSTNDTAIMMANGLANNKIITEEDKKSLKLLTNKLDEICASLSKMIVLDGEGITKTIIVSVRRTKTQKDAFEMAKYMATSNLIKLLFISLNPNYEKILSTIGNTNINIKSLSLSVNGINIYKNGELNNNKSDIKRLKDSFNKERKEHSIILDCGYNTKYEDYYYFTDITQEYIAVHSAYNI